MGKLHWLAAAAILLGAASAYAQAAPDTPPPPPGTTEPGMMHGPMGSRGGFMEMHGHHRPMWSKSAAFRFRRDGAEIDIKCAADEPTRSCVDAASVLIDKLAAVTAPK